MDLRTLLIWRTQAWAHYLVLATGLDVAAIGAELAKMRNPDEADEKDGTGFLGKYFRGEIPAFLQIRGKDGSWILLSEALAEGAVEIYLLAVFDLLEELLFRNDQEGARVRFLSRLQMEVDVGIRALDAAKFLDTASSDSRKFAIADSRLGRQTDAIYRCRHILSSYAQMFNGSFFEVKVGRDVLCDRNIEDINEEFSRAKDLRFVWRFTLALNLYVEALALGARERFETSRSILGSLLEEIDEEPIFAPFASKLVDFLLRELDDRKIVNYDPLGEFFGPRFAVTASSLECALLNLPKGSPANAVKALRESSREARAAVKNFQSDLHRRWTDQYKSCAESEPAGAAPTEVAESGLVKYRRFIRET